MRDYSKLSPFFWTRGSGKRLRGDAEAQVIGAYVSTSPTANMVGVYYLPISTIANDTGLPSKKVREALERIERAGYAYYDFDAELVWIPNHAKFEIGPTMKLGDKRRGRVLAEIGLAGEHRFVIAFWSVYGAAFSLGACPIQLGEQLPDAPSGRCDDPRAGQDQDSNRAGQDQRPDARASEPPSAPEGKSKRKPETECPGADASPEDVRAWLARWEIPPDDPLVPAFLLWHQKNDKRWRDWKAAFRDWKRREAGFAASPSSRRPQDIMQQEIPGSWQPPEGMM